MDFSCNCGSDVFTGFEVDCLNFTLLALKNEKAISVIEMASIKMQ
jgi:hypothetical protein